jgi:hypothetical protein
MDIEMERMWKEAVVAWFKGLSRRLPGGTEDKVDASDEIRNIHLPNTSQKHCRPRRLARCYLMLQVVNIVTIML